MAALAMGDATKNIRGTQTSSNIKSRMRDDPALATDPNDRELFSRLAEHF
jgi:hypothetical protein